MVAAICARTGAADRYWNLLLEDPETRAPDTHRGRRGLHGFRCFSNDRSDCVSIFPIRNALSLARDEWAGHVLNGPGTNGLPGQDIIDVSARCRNEMTVRALPSWLPLPRQRLL